MKFIVEMFLSGRWQYATSANTQRMAELLAAQQAVVVVFKDERVRLQTRVRDNDSGNIVATFS